MHITPFPTKIPHLLGLCALLSALPAQAQDTTNFPTIGTIERMSEELDALVPKDAVIQVLAGGFEWTEGPVWVPEAEHPNGGFLLFSEIPSNTVRRWDEGKGVAVYLSPSGYTGQVDYGAEPGSNGLLLDAEGRLVSCEHGDRRLSVLTKDGGKRTLADNYEGKRFNSPNDACMHENGDLYFTDPPYGLPKRWEDPRRELDYCGVFRIGKEGAVTLLTDEMTRPNGIAFSPDFSTLYVAQSDPEAAIWKAFPVKEDGALGESKVFYDATENSKAGEPGGCDGMKADIHGNLWATGPGGVWVFSPEGKALGRVRTFERISNCAWGNDGTVLYMTSDTYICRIQTTTKGAGWE